MFTLFVYITLLVYTIQTQPSYTRLTTLEATLKTTVRNLIPNIYGIYDLGIQTYTTSYADREKKEWYNNKILRFIHTQRYKYIYEWCSLNLFQ